MTHGIDVWSPLPAIRRFALLEADLVLAPSCYTADKLESVQGVPANRIRRLAWPLNPNFVSLADAPEMLPRPQSFPQARVILAVGRWVASERYKGADALIQCMAKLCDEFPDWKLVLVGSGDDLPRLKTLADESNVTSKVHFLENLSKQEIAACYAHCDVFALPSTGEGFGIVYLEAMAFAKPVVGASIGGTTDIIEDRVNGLLVPPNDMDALAESLSGLMKDEQLRLQMGRRGREDVRNKFTFDKFHAELEMILKDLGWGG